MKTHPFYDSSIRLAVERAAADYGACFSVYFDGTAMYVRASEAAAPKDARLVCMAQRWDADTVQVRYPGGHSEWVHI